MSRLGSLLKARSREESTLGHSLPYCVQGLQGCISVSVQVNTNGVQTVRHEPVAVSQRCMCSGEAAARTLFKQRASSLCFCCRLPPLHMLGCQVGDLMTCLQVHTSLFRGHTSSRLALDALHRNCGEPGSRTVWEVRLSSICHLFGSNVSCGRDLKAPSPYAISAQRDVFKNSNSTDSRAEAWLTLPRLVGNANLSRDLGS